MTPMQQLHDWCERGSYTYTTSFNMGVVIIHLESGSMTLTMREILSWGGEMKEMLDTMADSARARHAK